MPYDVAPLPGLASPYDLLAAILQDGTREWRGELWGAEIGPEEIQWRALPGGPSIGAEMLHIILVEIYWFEQVALGRPADPEVSKLLMVDEFDVDQGKWPTPPAEPMAWYLELQDRHRARLLESLAEWPPAETMRTLRSEQVSLRWIFGHVIQHESYHGGQIVLLHEQWKARRA